ncbi:MAG: hypothetical protein ACRD1G_19990 [Acidimicrobiales bacterium]
MSGIRTAALYRRLREMCIRRASLPTPGDFRPMLGVGSEDDNFQLTPSDPDDATAGGIHGIGVAVRPLSVWSDRTGGSEDA